jgi:nucleoside-diphosphate-sugar epimerase
VNGQFTHDSKAFKEIDIPDPIDEYAISKYEAELVLQDISSNSNLEIVIVRPPLIYCTGFKGNFYRLLGLVHSCIPLPFLIG